MTDQTPQTHKKTFQPPAGPHSATPVKATPFTIACAISSRLRDAARAANKGLHRLRKGRDHAREGRAFAEAVLLEAERVLDQPDTGDLESTRIQKVSALIAAYFEPRRQKAREAAERLRKQDA